MRTIFIALDTLRKDYLPPYGNTWVQAPAIARLAREGVTFDNHWVGSLPCMPARREFMTGRYNFLDRGWGPIEPFDDTLPVALRHAGVFSHLLTDHFHYFELGGENYHTAFDTWEFIRGQEYDPWVSLVDRLAIPEHLGKWDQQNAKNRLRQQSEEEFSGPRTVLQAIDWLRANHHADNWMLQVELFDPHEPFYCTEKYRALYNDTWDGPHFDWPSYEQVSESPEAIEHIRKCYAGLLTMTDHWVGRLFDTLDELGLWDDTMVVLTTDHGTMLAEHDYWMKNYMPMFNEIAQIPLIIRLPGGRNAGRRVGALTQTIDVMPTLLAAHGASATNTHGGSLLDVIEGATLRQDCIYGYFGLALNITDGRYVYMRNPVNDDLGPLYAYTAMPVGGLRSWYPRELYDRVEMGRYLSHTYNLPVYRIPAEGMVPRALRGEPGYVGRHMLYDSVADPQQRAPLSDPALEAQFVRRLAHHLRAVGAPPEQFTRLGIPTD